MRVLDVIFNVIFISTEPVRISYQNKNHSDFRMVDGNVIISEGGVVCNVLLYIYISIKL